MFSSLKPGQILPTSSEVRTYKANQLPLGSFLGHIPSEPEPTRKKSGDPEVTTMDR